MHVVVIGAMGHIGTYLVPQLVGQGFTVTAVSRGQRRAYLEHPAWQAVQTVIADRELEDQTGNFGKRIAALKPDIVIDLIGFTLDSTRQLVDALRNRIDHFLHCGSVAVYGHSVQVPTTENQRRQPYNTYGREKAAIESYLHQQTHRFSFPATVIHAGHIVGQGWMPINPVGHLNPETLKAIAHGEPITLPNLGMETLHHVHADDVVQLFMNAIARWGAAVGESFNAVSPAALTMRGYAEALYEWFGHEPALKYLPWDVWKTTVSVRDAEDTWGHLALSANCSIAKAQKLLDYSPRYRSLEAIFESIQWLIDHQLIHI